MLDELEVVRQLTDHENEIGSLKHRMSEVQSVVKEIHTMATSIELLAAEAKNTGEKVDKLTTKVECIEAKPAQSWDSLKSTIIGCVVTFVITMILTQLLK